MLRSATSALLRTSTEISSFCPVSTVRLVRQSLRYPPRNRPFSTSVCLCKEKKQRLWLQLAEGRTMDGNIEEILAPLRLAVKQQVTLTISQSSLIRTKSLCFELDKVLLPQTQVTVMVARRANRLTWPASCEAVNEWGQPLLASLAANASWQSCLRPLPRFSVLLLLLLLQTSVSRVGFRDEARFMLLLK